MHIAVLSDIHANQYALEAVLKDSVDWRAGVDAYWFLGDVVGYGPHPIAPLLFLKRYIDPDEHSDWVMGNHDAMLANKLDQSMLDATNGTAKEGIALNRTKLSEHSEALSYSQQAFTAIRLDPHQHHIGGVNYILAHSSLEFPITRYLFPWYNMLLLEEFTKLEEKMALQNCPQVALLGHTHIPFITTSQGKSVENQACRSIPVTPDVVYTIDQPLTIINPGSVGQPRDLNCRASYAILDTKCRQVVFRRVDYDWQATAHDMREGQYPSSLITRLMNSSAPTDTPQDWLDHFRSISTRTYEDG